MADWLEAVCWGAFSLLAIRCVYWRARRMQAEREARRG